MSPDKRTVFFQHEKELFAKLKSSLTFTFSKIDGICKRNTIGQASNFKSAKTSNNFPELKKNTFFSTQMSCDDIFEISQNDDLNNSLVDQDSFLDKNDSILSNSSPILAPISGVNSTKDSKKLKNPSRKRRLLEDCFVDVDSIPNGKFYIKHGKFLEKAKNYFN